MPTGTLFLCPTPLGNLEDITLRVLRTLREVHLLAAEDTRVTRRLLSHFAIHTRITSYHEHNKREKTPQLIGHLLQGKDLALVSDAGMPGIADPGEDLVREALGNGIPVVALPGPVAAVTALAASGLPASRFAFFGFLPARGKERKKVIAAILAETKTTVFYEAPHRLLKTLTELQEAGCCRQVVVARELTKVHEEYIRGTLLEVASHFRNYAPRGECTVLLAPGQLAQSSGELPPECLVEELMSTGIDKKTAIREAAQRLRLPRRQVYQAVHKKIKG